jgi:hypothetical protein
LNGPAPKKRSILIPAIAFFSILLAGCIFIIIVMTTGLQRDAGFTPGVIEAGTEKYRPLCFADSDRATLNYDSPNTMYTAVDLSFPNSDYEVEISVSAGSVMALNEKTPILFDPKGKAYRFGSGESVCWNPMDMKNLSFGRKRRIVYEPVDSAVITFTAYEGGVKKASGRIAMKRAGGDTADYTAELLELVKIPPSVQS